MSGPIPSRLPHPLILLLAAVGRRGRAHLDSSRRIASIAATIRPPAGASSSPAPTIRVERAPVGPFAAAVSVPRGFVAGADVIAVVLFVGGAWVVVDRLGTLPALVAVLVARFRRRGLWAIPVICIRSSRRWARSRTCRRRSSRSCRCCSCWARARRRRRGRGGDERGRRDDRQRVRPDESVSGGNRAQARATAAVCRRRAARCDVRRRIGRVDRAGRFATPRDRMPPSPAGPPSPTRTVGARRTGPPPAGEPPRGAQPRSLPRNTR